MAQLNITLNQEEILSLLQENSSDAFKKLLQESLNAVLKAESEEQLKAAPYERTEERTDSRNGSRERSLITRIGSIVLTVPRHRNEPFKSMIFENYSRSEAALIAAMAEMVVNGVSTRKVSRVVEELCGKTISKSSVSELCKDLDKEIGKFRERPLIGDYPFLVVDATYFKTRENHRIISKALMLALAINDKGMREIVGFELYSCENQDNWYMFLRNLQARGLKGLKMITSDAHEGIINAISRVFPDVPWQRCQFHFMKNITDKAPKKYREGLRAELSEMFHADDLKKAREKLSIILSDYSDIAPEAMECLELGFESSITAFSFPGSLRRLIRTSNHVERINKELKRRSKVIGVFPNGESILRLMGAVLVEHHKVLQTRQRLFSQPTYASILSLSEKLKKLAEQQRKYLAA